MPATPMRVTLTPIQQQVVGFVTVFVPRPNTVFRVRAFVVRDGFFAGEAQRVIAEAAGDHGAAPSALSLRGCGQSNSSQSVAENPAAINAPRAAPRMPVSTSSYVLTAVVEHVVTPSSTEWSVTVIVVIMRGGSALG